MNLHNFISNHLIDKYRGGSTVGVHLKIPQQSVSSVKNHQAIYIYIYIYIPGVPKKSTPV